MTELNTRILIVDDEPINIEVIADIFKGIYQIFFATDAQTALKLALNHQPDVILLDVMMPGINGFETCKQLKNQVQTAHIPVIFLTALGDLESEINGLSVGAADYVTKPFCPEIIKLRVQTQIELKQARERLADLASPKELAGRAKLA